MKKILLILLVLGCVTGFSFAQEAITLDEAIEQGARQFEGAIASGSKVVVLNFFAPTERFSSYVIDEMMANLVNGRKLVVVDRQNLELIQQEMDFQMSGEVSDESAQDIGQKLGAQSIISGSVEDLGNSYRLRFRAIAVESAAIQSMPSFSVPKDSHTTMLISGQSSILSQSPSTATRIPNGLNFTTSRKIGAGFLNIPLGIGSFTMGDIPGGLIVGGLEAVGVALLIIGIDSFYFSETSINGFVTEYEEGYEHEWAIYVGIGAFVGGVVYGFIRPFLYDTALAKKNGTYVASSNPLDNIDIDIIPGRHGIEQVSMSYTFRF